MTSTTGFVCIGSDNNTVTLQRVYNGKGSVKKRREYQKNMPKLVVHCFSESKYQKLREADAEVREIIVKRRAKKPPYMRLLEQLSKIGRK